MVYSVPCNECSRAYIGQTGRSLDHRIAEHQRALRNGDVVASALAEHVFTAGHKVDLSKATVIHAHPHAQTRCLLESWHIQHEQTPLNRGRGTCQDSMPPCWTDIVLCFYYIFCLTLHLIMYICRSMLPYYYSFIVGSFLFFVFNLSNFSASYTALCVSHHHLSALVSIQ